MWTFLEVFICGRKYIFSMVTNLIFSKFCKLNCALLCDSLLFIMSAKSKKSDVLSYLQKSKVNFLLEVILFL